MPSQIWCLHQHWRLCRNKSASANAWTHGATKSNSSHSHWWSTCQSSRIPSDGIYTQEEVEFYMISRSSWICGDEGKFDWTCFLWKQSCRHCHLLLVSMILYDLADDHQSVKKWTWLLIIPRTLKDCSCPTWDESIWLVPIRVFLPFSWIVFFPGTHSIVRRSSTLTKSVNASQMYISL